MPGRVPGMHVLLSCRGKDVDGRDKPGHDGSENSSRSLSFRFAENALIASHWHDCRAVLRLAAPHRFRHDRGNDIEAAFRMRPAL
jgi:hypothetical protein